MVSNTIVEEVIAQVAKDLNIPKEVVTVAYRSYFQMVKEVYKNIPFDTINSEEELEQHRISVNMPFLGKFYTNFSRIKHVRLRAEAIQKYNEENNIKH